MTRLSLEAIADACAEVCECGHDVDLHDVRFDRSCPSCTPRGLCGAVTKRAQAEADLFADDPCSCGDPGCNPGSGPAFDLPDRADYGFAFQRLTALWGGQAINPC